MRLIGYVRVSVSGEGDSLAAQEEAIHRWAERLGHEVVAVELLPPVAVGVELIDVHSSLLATVAGEIALPVAVDVQPPDPTRALNRLLPDSRDDRPALPRDLSRHTDVDRDECREAR